MTPQAAIERYLPNIRRAALAFARSRDSDQSDTLLDHEDFAQEICLDILKGHQRSWRYAMIDVLRGRTNWRSADRPLRVHIEVINPGLKETGCAEPRIPSHEQGILSQLGSRWMLRALQILPDREYEIIRLLYWGGLTNDEIGQRFHIHASRVSQLHTESLKKLRYAMLLTPYASWRQPVKAAREVAA